MKKQATKSKSIIIFDFNRTLYDPDKTKLMPNARLILSALKKREHSLYLICRAAPSRAELIANLRIDKYFTQIIIAPFKSTNMFTKIISNEKSRIAYVIGDRIKKEITIGNRVGAITIWLQTGTFASELPNNVKEQPTHTINNLLELLKIIS